MTKNITAGYRVWTGEVTFSTTGDTADGYGAGNLGALPLSLPWRSGTTDLLDTQFRGSLSQLRRIDNLWLCSTNLSRDAKVRRSLFRREGNSPAVEIYNSGWVKWLDSVYTFDQVDHDGGNLHDRSYTEEELAGAKRDHPFYIDGNLYADEFLIEIDDQGNSDGFVQVGFCPVEEAVEFTINPAPSSQDGFRARTKSSQAQSGHKDFDVLAKPRVFSGNFDHLPKSEAKGVVHEMQRLLDINQPYTWWIDRDDQLNRLRDAWLGRNEDLPALTHQSFGRCGASINNEEVIG